MKGIKICIGIDISKNWLDLAVIECSSKHLVHEFKCDNTAQGLKELKTKLLANRIRFNKSTFICFEHAGPYGRILLNFLIKHKCLICIESSLQIKKSLGINRGKTDSIDAIRIAEYAHLRLDKLRVWQHPRLSLLYLKDLLTLRDRLVKMSKAVKTPINELRGFYNLKDFKRMILVNEAATMGLNTSLTHVSKEIERIISSDEKINRLVNLLKSVPGIGLITALYLICYTNEFSITDSGKRLASYIGVAPFEYSSGSSIKGKSRVSHIANKKLKGLIHAGAASTIRLKGEYRAYYERKLNEGKHKMSVLNAVCNKILRRVSAVIKRGTPYIKEKSSLTSV